MKSSKRALRRHHRQRMIQRALRSLVLSWREEDEAERLHSALRWYNNLKKCSCWMCGNPRRYGYWLTWQEQRQLRAALDDRESID